MMKRPMKGEAIDVEHLDKLTYPMAGFPKIDGFRCVLDKHPLTSRLGRFRNVSFHNALSGLLPRDSILDSEVTVGRKRGRGVLSRTSSGLTSEGGNPDFNLWVFDHFHRQLRFAERYDVAARLVRDLGHPNIKMLKYRVLHDADEAKAYLERNLDREYEGIVLRTLDGPYKEGKSTVNQQWMLKLKPFEDAEGRIIGWYEEMENTNEAKREVTGKLKRSSAKSGKIAKGQLGGFILEDCETGVEVRVGGGFTLDQRRLFWKIIQRRPKTFLGKLVKYKKQKMGEKDKPRSPNFVDFINFRPDWDMAD